MILFENVENIKDLQPSEGNPICDDGVMVDKSWNVTGETRILVNTALLGFIETDHVNKSCDHADLP